MLIHLILTLVLKHSEDIPIPQIQELDRFIYYDNNLLDTKLKHKITES